MNQTNRAPGRASAQRRYLPFIALCLVSVLVAVLPPTEQVGSVIAASALALVMTAAALLVPWELLPEWTEAVIPLLFYVVIVFLRSAEGGGGSGYSPLVLFPVVWFALYGGRLEVGLATLLTGAVFLFPILAYGPPRYPYSDSVEVILWMVVAGLIGSSVHLLVRNTGQRLADLQSLSTAARGLTIDGDARSAICRAAQEVTAAQFALLLEPDSTGLQLTSTASYGVAEHVLPLVMDQESSFSGRAMAAGRRVLLPDVVGASPAAMRLLESSGVISAVLEPVFAEGGTVGVLVLGFRTRVSAISERTAFILQVLAADAAAAIDRGNLVSQLRVLAGTDPLTGVLNRRSWDARLTEETIRSARTGAPLTLLVIDLDNFKTFNDVSGHAVGDRLLIEFADVLRGLLRGADVLARWGGEEFTIALPSCTRTAAHYTAERIRAAVPYGQTCSIGIAEWDGVEDLGALFRRADAMLYRAKSSGRNQVAVDVAADPARIRRLPA